MSSSGLHRLDRVRGGGAPGGSGPAGLAPTEVLTAVQLANLLVTPADLDDHWQTDDTPFGDRPNGQRGVVLEDPVAQLPTPAFCEDASAEAWAANLQWQAFTQLIEYLDVLTSERAGHGLVVQEGLLSSHALRDDVAACFGGPTDLGYATWTSKEPDLGDVGDDRNASRDVLVGHDGRQTSSRSGEPHSSREWALPRTMTITFHNRASRTLRSARNLSADRSCTVATARPPASMTSSRITPHTAPRTRRSPDRRYGGVEHDATPSPPDGQRWPTLIGKRSSISQPSRFRGAKTYVMSMSPAPVASPERPNRTPPTRRCREGSPRSVSGKRTEPQRCCPGTRHATPRMATSLAAWSPADRPSRNYERGPELR